MTDSAAKKPSEVSGRPNHGKLLRALQVVSQAHDASRLQLVIVLRNTQDVQEDVLRAQKKGSDTLPEAKE